MSILHRFDPSRPGQKPIDRGPLILSCDGCQEHATPSKALERGWVSQLGTRRGKPVVLDLCGPCVVAIRSGGAPPS